MPDKTIPFPRERQVILDAGRMGTRRHLIHGLLEIDITTPRDAMKAHQSKTGEKLSFTGFVAYCLGQAISAQPMTQAYRTWRNQLMLFDEVDVVVMIETAVDGVALPHIIRAANQKSLWDIHAEIRAVQAQPKQSQQSSGLTKLGAYAPHSLRDLFYWLIRKNPRWLKKNAGTSVITSVGMFGQGSGWGFGFLPMHTLGLTLGGIARKPGLLGDKIVPREYLCLTLTFDHDIVDGAPAARFANHLKMLLESGQGLPIVKT